MRNKLLPYLAVLVVLLGLDALWLGLIATDWYDTATGHLTADVPSIGAAAAFYLIFPVGLMIFAVTADASPTLRLATGRGALFGFFAYATYNLTNLATLADWPLYISVLDIVWGTALSAVATAAGKVCVDAQRR